MNVPSGIRKLLTLAGVAVWIASVTALLTAATGSTIDTKPQSRGTPYPQALCETQPRTIEDLLTIEESATPLPDTYPITTFHGDLPTGAPATPEMVAGVTRTIQQLVACHLAGDGLRLAALFTTDLLKRTTGIAGPSLLTMATPDSNPNQGEYLVAVEDVQLLADGTVSAIVTRGGVEDSHPAPGRTVLIIFVEEGDQWLIDGLYERVWPGGSDSFPIAIADAVATPKSRS